MTDSTPPTNEGPGKGRTFFERARTVAQTGNHDYAIDMYIEGLNREPFNLEEHKALRNVAMMRKIAGGKAPGGLLGPKTPYKGKLPKEAMLNAEWILAKDVGHIPSMLTMVRNAALLGQSDHGMVDVAVWMGDLLRQANATSKTPKVEIFLELSEHLEKLKAYDKALEAMQGAIKLKPLEMEFQSRAKDLAAQHTIFLGKYEKGEDFKESIKDREGTKDRLEDENLNKSEEFRLKIIEQAKADYEKNPKEVQVINKYYRALAEMDDESYENRAIDMLTKAFADTKIYRWKVGIGDIRIKQFNRNLRMIKDAFEADRSEELKRQYETLMKEKLAFELQEYRERSDNFPTDMHVKFEYGARLFATQHYDDAIVALQEAQNSPKHRVEALHLLGRSFMAQKMVPEALDTFKKSIDEYDLASTGDKKAKELYYYYGIALQENGDSSKAKDVFSQIVRWDIGYKDARKRLDDLRSKS